MSISVEMKSRKEEQDGANHSCEAPARTKASRLGAVDCVSCGGRCCHYVTCPIDTPETVEEADNVRWYLLHREVSVFIDLRGQWFVQFDTSCEDVTEEGRCSRYTTRPTICRDYGEDGSMCEYESDRPPYQALFRSVEEFNACISLVSEGEEAAEEKI